MELITVDRCLACSVIKSRYPEVKTRKPKLDELTKKKFETYPTLLLDDGTQINQAPDIILYIDSMMSPWT